MPGLTVLAFAVWIASLHFQSPCLAGGKAFEYKVIAQSGRDGLAGVKSAPSINDSDAVAFVGRIDGGEGVFAYTTGRPRNITPNHATFTFSTFLQLNNYGYVITRTARGGIFAIRSWGVDFIGDPVDIDITSGKRITYCTGGTFAGQPCTSAFDCADLLVPGLYWPCSKPPSSPFLALLFPSMNNQGEVAYYGENSASKTKALASTSPDGGFVRNLDNGFSSISPMVADNGFIVGRAGDLANRPLWLFRTSDTNHIEIASAANGFGEIGKHAGISDDGTCVVFHGNLTDPTLATGLGTNAGPGIFVYFTDSQTIQRIAGQNSGATSDLNQIVGFFPNERANANNSGRVIFLATLQGGTKALCRSTVNLLDGSRSISIPEVVLQMGDTVEGLPGSVQDIGIWDSINNKDDGHIAASVVMSGGEQAILLIQDSSCQSCRCAVGDLKCRLSSLEVDMGLGTSDDGGRSASVRIQASVASTNLSTPQALSVSAPGDFSRVYAAGVLRQLRGPRSLADIQVVSPYRYEVRFYKTAGAQDPASGLFAPAGPVFSTIIVENPDGATASNRLRLTRNGADVNTYSFDPASGTWTLTSGFANALRTEVLEERVAADTRTRTRTVQDSSGTALSQSVEVFQTFPWGEELVETREGAATPPRTTRYTYFSSPTTDGANYSHLRSVLYPEGRWEFYKEYSASKGLLRSVSQFQSNPYAESATWPDPNNRSSEVSYQGPIETRTEYLLGHAISRRWHVDVKPGETWDSVATNPTAKSFDDPSNLITRTLRYLKSNTTGAKADQVSQVVRPDGTQTIYGYYCEQIDDPFSTNPVPPKLEIRRTASWSGTPSTNMTSVIDGQLDEEATDAAGNLLWHRQWDIATKALLSSETVKSRDEFGRPTRTEYLDGTYTTRTYDCCGLALETDREGITTTYNTDHVVSLDLDGDGTPENYYGSTVTRAGIATHSLTDPLGRAFKTIIQGSNGKLIVQDERHYNGMGEIDWSKDAVGRLTTYSQTNQGGFTVRTTTFPDGSQSIESSFQDGSAYETRGDAAQNLRYANDVRQDGEFWVQTTTQTRLEKDGSVSPEYTTTFTDFAGRSYKTEFPWPDGAGPVLAIRSYNALGQLDKSTDPDGITTLYVYNERGELTTTAIDLANPGIVDFAGTDRITRTLSSVENSAGRGTVVRKSVTELWEANGVEKGTTIQVTETSVDGTQTWHTQYGLTTQTRTVIDRDAQRRTTTTQNPDGTSSVTVHEQGRQKSITRLDKNGVRVTGATFAYDAFGRLQTQTDARNGSTTYTYFDDGQVQTITTPDPDPGAAGPGLDPQTTRYTYFRDPTNGIKTVTTTPDGGEITQEYFPGGQLKKTWGARTYPAEYTYDRAGRMETLTTWQHFNFLKGTGIAGSATTRWNYNARGLLANKRYADNKGPSYTYTAGGKLRTRLWARGVLTTYGYDNKTGDLLTTTYSDPTPPVTNTYARSGQLQSVTDASGLRTFGYRHGQTVTESYGPGLLAGFTLVRDYDDLDRQAALSVTSPTGRVYHVTYGYDPASRLNTVTSGPDVALYTYHPDSDMVHTLTQSHSNAVRLTTTKLYDRLGRLQSITSVPSADDPIRFAYQYNDANQRTCATLANGEYWTYGYDPLGQVTNGVKRFPDGTAVPGYSFGYQFDHIGNRLAAIRDGRVDTYTNTELNQIDGINYSPWLHVLGVVSNNPTITVNGQTPLRTNGYFYAQVPAIRAWNTVTIQARAAGKATNGLDALAEATGHFFQPINSVRFEYDEDGNLRTDARWSLDWDGENRLRDATSHDSAGVNPPHIQINYVRDSQGRRLGRRVSEQVDAEGHGTATVRSLHDNWSVVLELQDTGKASRHLAWGGDSRGVGQQAGGAGGLLVLQSARVSSLDSQTPAYDGNGNVIAMVSGASFEPSYPIEYGPFAELIRADKSGKETSSYGFSTKCQDSQTAFLDYGHRLFDSKTGRWLARDPLNEIGHILAKRSARQPFARLDVQNDGYLFVKNDSLNRVDLHGEFVGADDLLILGAAYSLAPVIAYFTSPAGQDALQQVGNDVLLGMEDAALAARDTAQAVRDSAVGATQLYDDMCNKLNRVVQESKRSTQRLGACECGMSCWELHTRRAAWLAEAVARTQRDVLCWGGGDIGHIQQQIQAWKNVNTCNAELKRKNCPSP